MEPEKFTCTVCHRFSSPTLRRVLRHIGAVHSFDPGFSITCGVEECARTYHNFKSFQRHLQRRHKAVIDNVSEEDDPTGSADEFDENSSHSPPFPNTQVSKSTLKRSAALFLLKTKEIGRVSQVALNTIIEGVTELFQAHSNEEIVTPFVGLESEYLQRKFFKEEFNMLVCYLLGITYYSSIPV